MAEGQTSSERVHHLPREDESEKIIFHDNRALLKEFYGKVSDPEWIEGQLEWMQLQHQHWFQEQHARPDKFSDLVGLRSLALINPLQHYDERPKTLEFSSAWAFAFLYFNKQTLPTDLGDPEYIPEAIDALAAAPEHPVAKRLNGLDQRLRGDFEWLLKLPKLEIDYPYHRLTQDLIVTLEMLGFSSAEIKKYPDYLWLKALDQIMIYRNDVEVFLYTLFVVDKALLSIQSLIPDWKDLIEVAKKRMILNWGNRRSEETDGSLISGSFHQILLIIKDRIISTETFAEDVLLGVHELTHAIIEEYIFGKNLRFTLTKVPAPVMMGVIHEAIAITLEEGCMSQNDIDPDRIRISDRIEQARRIARTERDVPLTEFKGALHYSDGIRVSTQLRNRGWRVENIPILVDRLVKLTEKLTGQKAYLSFVQNQVSRDPDSIYQRVLTALLQEKPPLDK